MLARMSKKLVSEYSFPITRRNPLVVYFILSIAFTWIVNLLMVGFFRQEAYTFSLISGFGPVLSAMFVSSIIDTKKSEYRISSWLLAFISVLLIAGLVRWISRTWWKHSLDWSVLPGDIILVVLATFVIASAFSEKHGIQSLLKPYLNWRVSWIWYVIAILFSWLYNRTKGKSLLPVLLLHVSMNATNDYLPRVKLTVYALLGIVVLVIIFTDRMWLFKSAKETD